MLISKKYYLALSTVGSPAFQYKDNDGASCDAGAINDDSSQCMDDLDGSSNVAGASIEVSSKRTDNHDHCAGGEGTINENSPQFSTDRPAYELRAIAASMSLHRGKPYAEVIKAVGWSSASTFGRFYLRHLGISEAVSQQPLPLP